MSKRNKVIIYIKLLATAIFWGGTFIAGRVVARDVGPFSAAFLRFAIASIFLLFITYQVENRLPPVRKAQVIPLILLGMTGVFSYNVFFFKGLKIIHAGRASVIIASNPVFIALFASYLFKERLNLTQFAGIILSVSGAIVVISRGNPIEIFQGNVGMGEVFIFLCVMSWVAYSLLGKAAMKDLSALVAVSYSSVVGAVALSIPAYLEGITQHYSFYTAVEWFGIFYLGFFGTVLGFVWYYEGIKAIGATKASQFINFVPISAVLLAFFLLAEPITSSLVLGTIMVCTGTYLTN
ncbi:MAG: DMT family transporter [Deltaproteobacteria bacterium]|nr:DMT family transporter [Deltaproteobacteria bacterium]